MSTSDIHDKVAQTRAQLESTLDEIEDKLNVPKQVESLLHRAQESYEKDPVPWIAGAAAAVTVIGGLVVWAFSSRD